jgi:hypothetical protein
VPGWPKKHATVSGPGQPEAHRERGLGKGRTGAQRQPWEVALAAGTHALADLVAGSAKDEAGSAKARNGDAGSVED